MPPSQFGHSAHGINLTNYRLVSQATAKKKAGTYRTPAEWAQETKEHVTLGSTEQKQSSTLRYNSNLLQTAAADQVNSDLSTVENALKAKIGQTEALKSQLEACVRDVDSELAALLVLKGTLEQRLDKVKEKETLNASRLQVRDTRPGRERTMDDVERALLRQKALIQGFADKVVRATQHVDKEVAALQAVKAKLAADLKDKMEAIEVDSAVMAVGTDGTSLDATGCSSPTSAMRCKHDCLMKTPHTWARSTEENLTAARHLLTDAARLRKAVRHGIATARAMEHEVANSLNTAMSVKLVGTQHLKDDLDTQLAKVRDESAKAAAHRTKLAIALEAKRGPLAQAKERFAIRRARPCRESVQDDVEAALCHEIAHLNAVTTQLSDKMRGVDKELDALALAGAMLQDNLRDKETALDLDERCAMLDGRINVSTAPPSSIASYASSASSARSATLRRIADLEAELTAARREREALEAGVGQLRTALGTPPNHLQ